jgi:VCBS repeat-containing protein
VSLTAGDGPATRTIFLRVTDAAGAPGMDSALVTIRNLAPVAQPDAYTTDEDTPLDVAAPGVLGNDTDFDPLAAVLVAGPAHGTLGLLPDGSFTYAPAANFNGADSFTYRAHDGVDESAETTVGLAVNSVNDTPTAEAGGPYAVDEGGSLALAGSGTDVEPGALTFAWDLDGDGAFDDATGPSPSFSAGDGPATVTIAVRVTDADGASATDSATIEVRNVAPVTQADSSTTDEDTPLAVSAPGVLGNDSDFDPLTATLVTGPDHGTLSLQADGSFAYTPEADFNGADSFTYRAHDGIAESADTVVTLTVQPVNDAPTAEAGGPYAVDEGASLALAGSGTDVEPGALAFAWDFDGDGQFDDATGASPAFTAGGGPATVTVSVRVTDVDGASATDSATIEVRNVAPAAQEDAYTTDEDTALTVAAPGLLANDADFDPLTAVLASGPAHGTLTLHADGSFTYLPAANFNGSDSFTYRADDGASQSAPAAVSLTIHAVNDAPAAEAGGPYTVNEGGSVAMAGSGADVEGGPLTFAWDFDGDGVFDDASGPSPSYDAGDGPATVTVALRVTDAEGASAVDSATIQVDNVAPVAQADAYVGPANATLVVPAPGVLGNDTDFDPLAAVLVTPPAHGTLTLHADGSFEYQPSSAATASDTFTYRASDGTAQSAPATVTIALSAPQGAPDAVNDAFVIHKRRHRPHRLSVLANDTAGPGGGTLLIVAVTQPQHGTVKIGPGGTVVVYQARRRFRGTDTFTYTVRNSNGLTDTATVTVDVRKRLGPGPDDDDDDDHGDCGGDDHNGH